MKYEYKRKDVKVRQLDGSYKVKSIRAKTDKELNAKVKQIQAEAEQKYQLSLCPFFSDVADEWNYKHEAEIAYNTWSGYQAPIKDLKAEFEGLRISEITPFMLQALLEKMKAQGYARQTINLRKVAASLIFEYAVVMGYIVNSPCSNLKVPKNAAHSARELPSSNTIDIILNAKGNFADIARFLYFTGCRRSEALALTADDIKNGYIRIDKTLYWQGQLPQIKNTPKTSSGVRDIPILLPIQDMIEKKKGILFKGKNGYMTRSEWMKGWANFQKENSISITAHQLRHSFATLCYDAELDEKEASELLGHSSVEITKDIYTHITNERKKVSAEKLNRQFIRQIS